MACAEDADLRQAHHQGRRHGGLVVVPASDGAGNVAADDGARGGKAVIGQEHAARLQLKLERGERNQRTQEVVDCNGEET